MAGSGVTAVGRGWRGHLPEGCAGAATTSVVVMVMAFMLVVAATVALATAGGLLGFRQVTIHGLLIEGWGFPLLNGNGTLGALGQAGTEAVAIDLRHQAGFAIDDRQGPLVAGADA